MRIVPTRRYAKVTHRAKVPVPSHVDGYLTATVPRPWIWDEFGRLNGLINPLIPVKLTTQQTG